METKLNTETKLKTVNLTAWVQKECDIMDEDALLRLQGAWENPQQKDECSVCMDDLEWDCWMGTKVGQLGGYRFQGAIFGVDGSCKDGTMGSGCCNFRGKRQTNVHKSAEKRKARVRTGRSWGEMCWRYSQRP